MKPMIPLALGFLFFSSCSHDQQRGYTHNPNQLNEEDRSAIRIVENSPLGKPEVMRPLFSYIGDISQPSTPCEYWVTKIVERDAPKYSNGLYGELFEVTCYTSVSGDDVELEFVWTVRDVDVVSFHWGTTPDLPE
jgi:hypothetical protein